MSLDPPASLAALPPDRRRAEILAWLRETDAGRLAALFDAADGVRRAHVGDAVHLRGLIEISNICRCDCLYCGLRASNAALPRYRMTRDEILECAAAAVAYGYGTVVLQAGESDAFGVEDIAALVREIKAATPLAVTLGLGERPREDWAAWKAAGADRYLLRHETSDTALLRRLRPAHLYPSRIDALRVLQALGFETGSGIMVGLPGQSYASVAGDIMLFADLDLDMVGIGPYIPHPATPLAGAASNLGAEQAPATEAMALKAVALARLACPCANIPATTALATINRTDGRESALRAGANVVMPNLTPARYRRLYEIYPEKACIDESSEHCDECIKARIRAIGRTIGTGPGSRAAPPR
ncbi:MAG TPA: [FeFe] hydrogenase H-cluster radical SAM maturase HydE [Planctomycetes bacterium]|nr:[FeFe] hydrogenase H-cluster radical SAM maturase HydE [Planctomycetota bacterium]